MPIRHLRRTAAYTLLLLLAPAAGAMSFLNSEKVLFSPVSGVVLDGGQPVAGAVVKRSYLWSDLRREDETVTDQAGEFAFEAGLVKSLLWSIIPHSPAIMQSITIHIGDRQFDAWTYQKGDYALNSESSGKPFSIRCELTDEAQEHDLSELSSYFGICTLR